MARDDLIQMEGEVVKIASANLFRVKLENGQEVNAKLCGKMRRFHIRVIQGDKVTIGLSPYDVTHGLILYRK